MLLRHLSILEYVAVLVIPINVQLENEMYNQYTKLMPKEINTHPHKFT